MSWSRKELKTRAKAAFHKNYWVCVLVAFILSFTGANPGSSVNFNSYSNYFNDYEDDYDNDSYFDYYSDADSDFVVLNTATPTTTSNTLTASTRGNSGYLAAISVVILIIVAVIAVAASLLSIFVFQPLQVGGCHFFLENAVTHNAGISPLAKGFKNNYKGVVGTMFLRTLYTFLWSLLFIIPGIIKALEYRMVPYILADHPEMSTKEVFALSRQMMDGEKRNAFVLDLSFLGWQILAAFTCGILNIFYVNPYIHSTNAELYLTLKKNKCTVGYQPYETYTLNTNYENPYM